ncbi:MAG TPA: hypothetical protein VIZ43_25035 [Trebonia sp.]
MDTDRIDVRRDPLVVRDGCAPERTPPGRWPSDDALVRSEQFAVNEAIACRAGANRVLGVHAPPGTGVAEVFGDIVAAVVTERARRIADLVYPAAAFGEEYAWGPHAVTAVVPELAGLEIVLTAPEAPGVAPLQGPCLPPIGTGWRDRAARADYFASTARLADGVGAWAMLAARLGDRPANRAFAERWWHGAGRGTDVLFPAGESMAAALRRLKGTRIYWPACVARFRSALEKVEALAAERMEAAAALTRLSELERACAQASRSAEAAGTRLTELVAREPAAREAAAAAEDEYRAALAALGAHELGRPDLAALTPEGAAALRSRGALSVALAGALRRGRNWRSWSIERCELRAACATTGRNWEEALHGAERLREGVAAARSAAEDRAARLSRLAAQMTPLAAAVATARERWGDRVPADPSQAETEDPSLIERRETSAPWADEEYSAARAEAFVAALELHKALIVAQADVFEANLAALMDLIAADPAGDDDTRVAEVTLAAWRSFFLVVPVVQVPFESAASLLDGLRSDALGWLLAAGADQVAAEDASGLLPWFDRAVFAGDTVLTPPRPELARAAGISALPRSTAQDLADRLVRYGTWLPGRPTAGAPGGAGPRWLGTPLRVVRGQDRITVERRNELGYDGLLITDRE